MRRVAATLLLTLFAVAAEGADPIRHRSFATPEAAGEALGAAYATGKRPEIAAVLGDKAMKLVKSGDPVIDRHEREWFLTLFRRGHSVERDGERAVLLLGDDEELPYPIPIVARDGKWRFDPSEGVEDLLSRRMGKTELVVLDFLLQFVKGQRAHFAVAREPGGVHEYARRFVGDPQRRDGLVYVGADGKLAGPMARVGAAAMSEGYRPSERLYHGYRLHPVESQGPNAPGGARGYLVDGRLTQGFAVVACPARYAVSGVFSYMVNQDGVVYHRDFGSKTGKACPAITRFDPGRGWTRGASE